MADANIRAVITAEDKASAVVGKFGKQVEDTNERTVASAKNSAIALAAATAGAVAFGKKSLDAFMTQELATARLQQGINNVKTATDKHIGSLLNQATALQMTTRFSDEAVISAQGILSTFQLNQKAIESLTPRLLDMSEGLARVDGTMPDLEGNAILVAKAIGGEDVNGLAGALRRVGVIMTEHQTQILQTGNMQQRLAIITEILDQNFQGLANAAGSTTAGKIARLKNEFGELMEKVGGVIAVALSPLLNILNKSPALLAGLSAAVGFLAIAFIALRVQAIAATGALAALWTAALGPLGVAIAVVSAAVGVLTYVLGKHKQQADEQTASTYAQSTASELLTQQLHDQEAALDDVTQKTKALSNAQFDAEGAALAVERAQRSYTDSVNQYGPNSLEAREAAHSLKEAQNRLEDATNKAKVAQDNLIESQKLQIATEPATSGSVLNLASNFDRLAGSSNAAAGAINGVISNGANFLQNANVVLQGAISNLQSRVQNLQGSFSRGLQGGGGVQGFQHGVTNFSGGLALVGEAGPELVRLPKGSDVIPNNQIGGVGANVNITLQSGVFMGTQLEARKFADMILTAMKDLGSSKNMTVAEMIR